MRANRIFSRLCSALLLVFALLPGGAGVASAEDDPHAACAAPPGYVPAELLERAIPRREGVGNSHEKVTTKSAEAQAFYDQGLNYLESTSGSKRRDRSTRRCASTRARAWRTWA